MRLRIAHVVPYSLDLPGGVAHQALGLARWLTTRGHYVELIAPGLLTHRETFPVHLLGRSTGLRFNGSTAHLALSRKQASDAMGLVMNADVIHVHEPLTPGMAYVVARRSAKPLVVTHHAAYSHRLAFLLRRRASRLPRRVALAVSGAAADAAYYATGRRPRVVPNALSLPPAPKFGVREPTVVFLGRRDDPRKGYSDVGRLARELPGARFISVGPGRRSEDAVEELGQVDEQTKERVLLSARILVVPARYGESFGMVLIEALARGVAIVGYGLSAFRAVVDDPRVATWVPVGDYAALRHALIDRLNRPADPLTAWAAAADFSWQRIGPRVEDAYRAALAGHDIG